MPTSYVKDMLYNMSDDGFDDDLLQMVDDDARLLEKLEVEGERQRNLVFYLDLFLDELCDETGFPMPSDRDTVITKAFNELRNTENVDLTDIRSALYRAMGGRRTKVAYPNTAGVMETNMKPQRNVDKWVKTLGEIHAAERIGAHRDHVFRSLTEEWDPVEITDFQQWLRYYERGDHEKYAAVQQPPVGQQVEVPLTRVRRKPEERSIEENRKSLIGRLDSAKKLLRLFVPPVWSQERWNSIYRALSDLEQEITGLRTASSMRDRIIRTAGLWTREGFHDGAETLLKIAQEPGQDIASQIEKALTGHEYEIKPSGTTDLPSTPPSEDLGSPSPMPDEPSASPDANAAPEGMPPGAMESLPEPPPPPEPKPEPETENSSPKDENPFAGSTIMDIINTLEPIVKRFKERETVRQLSKVDMMMDSRNIVSYFPELGEAIGRLLETDSYVGTRLEKIIGKLRGGLRDESDKQEKKAPSVDMGPSAEETAASVSEKPAEQPTEQSTEKGKPSLPPAPAEETATEVKEQLPAKTPQGV